MFLLSSTTMKNNMSERPGLRCKRLGESSAEREWCKCVEKGR